MNKIQNETLTALDSRSVHQRDSLIFIKWSYNVIRDDFDLTEYQQVDYTGLNKVKNLTPFFYQELRGMDIVRLQEYSILIFRVREYSEKDTWISKWNFTDEAFSS